MADPASWDLLDESFDNLDDWTDQSVRSASASIDPTGQCKLDSGATSAANNDYARIFQDIGSVPNTFTIEIKLYHDALGSVANIDYLYLYVSQVDEFLYIYFSSDGLMIYDTVEGLQEVGTDLVKHSGSAEWQTWRFLITFTGTTGEGTCDVYLKDSTHDWEKIGTAIPCSFEAGITDGEIQLNQYGFLTNNQITHVDYYKIATGLFIPEAEVADNAVFFGANF